MSKKQAFNAIVTGGVQGIGHSIAETLNNQGACIHIFDCLAPDSPQVAKLIAQGYHYHQVDVTSVNAIQQGFLAIPGPIHVLVNNAGITRDGLAIRLKEQDWDNVLSVNLKGSFFCAQEAIKRMIRQEIIPGTQARGYIINISSIVALTGNPGQANYVASKAGIIGITKTLAQEYASRNILVNAIAPGFIQTAMTDKLPEAVKAQALTRIGLKRFGSPQDIANLVAFLSSGNADYITGQVFEVSGGMA